MPFSQETLTLYLLGSVLFCWFAVWMARPAPPAAMLGIKNLPLQRLIVPASFAFIFAVSVIVHRVPGMIPKGKATYADIAFAGLMLAAAFGPAAAAGDPLKSLGLSLRGAETVVFFLVPAAALVFLPGHFVSLKLLAKGVSVAVAAGAFAEELFFRGYMQTRLQLLFGNTRGLLAAAAAFTFFRIPLFSALLTPAGFALNTAVTFLFWGCIAGAICRRAGSIYGLALLRIFWESASVAFIGFGVG